MQTRKDRWQGELFVAGGLEGLVPADHVLRRVDRALDFSWIHEEVRGCYCQDNGRPSIDPESALRLMLAGFFQGITEDRRLMREAQVNLAIRWFAGYRLDETLPDHSSLTRIRARWGVEVFRRVFERTVRACMDAGLVDARTVHVDATLIRADVSWDSLVTRHADQVLEDNTEPEPSGDEGGVGPEKPRGRRRPRTEKAKRHSPTDPDATMATSSAGYHLEPSYKQHTAVEDSNGVVVDVEVTTGERSEGAELEGQLARVRERTGVPTQVVTCDAGYAWAENYDALERAGTDAVIPPARTARRAAGTQRIPARRFKYDEHNGRVVCPAGNTLRRGSRDRADTGTWYRACVADCRGCPMRDRCLSPTARVRQVFIVDGYPALLRARRRKEKGWDAATRERYRRHRWLVEGTHGQAKTRHGLRRAARRGLDNVRIQAYLTAAVMNLKKCAGAFCALWRAIGALLTPPKHHLRKNHANIPGGGRRMRTELGKRKLEGVSQQLHCPYLF